MEKKVKRKINVKKVIFFVVFILIICISVRIVLNERIRNIVILNNNYYSDEKIIETAKLEKYPKFILLNSSKVKKDLMKLDLIEDVKVYKKWGYILKLDIKEKKILYYVRSNNMYKASDGKDYSLEATGVPTLINYVPEDIEEKFIKNLSKVDSNIINMISEIEYSKSNFDNDRFLLYMNDGNEVYITTSKLNVLNKYVTIVTKLDGKKGILYLDNGNYFEIKEK
jgi:cell division protein FtsQ